MQTDLLDEWVTPEEAARRALQETGISVSARTVKIWADNGDIRWRKFRKRILVNLADVLALNTPGPVVGSAVSQENGGGSE